MCVHPNQDGAVLGVQDPPSFVATLLACAQDGGLQTVVSDLQSHPRVDRAGLRILNHEAPVEGTRIGKLSSFDSRCRHLKGETEER